jgi:predicted nucleic acid-binding protein
VNTAYVDTSCVVAVAFKEKGSAALQKKLARFDELFASNLLEAELRSVCAREKIELDESAFQSITWVLPDRPLRDEMRRCVTAGYVRGTDLWHVACALYVAAVPSDLAFITLDERQQRVAVTLGFRMT